MAWAAVLPLGAQETQEAPVFEDPGWEVVASAPGTTPGNPDQGPVLAQDLEAFHPLTAAQALQGAWGLLPVENGGYGNQSSFVRRGFGGTRTSVVVDGVRVNSAQSGGLDLASLPVTSLQSVEVTSAASGPGGAPGGSLVIDTVPPPVPAPRVGASVWTLAFDTQGLEAHAQGPSPLGDWSWAAAGHRALNGWRPGNQVADASVHGTWDAALAPGTRGVLTWSALGARRHIPGPEGASTSAAGVQDDFQSLTSWRYTDGTWAGGTGALGLTLGHQASWIGWTSAGTTTDHRLQTLSAAASAAGSVGAQTLWSAAAEARASWAESDALGQRQVAEAVTTLGLVHGTLPRWSAQADLVTAPGEAPVWAPRLGVEAPVPGAGTLGASVFRAYRRPTLNDLYWPDDGSARGNPGLAPEDGWGAEAWGAGALGPGGAWEVTLHETSYRNAILWASTAGVWQPENLGEAQLAGLDLAGTWTQGPLEVRLRYSYLMSWVLSGALTWADDKRLPYAPVHAATLTALWTLGPGRLDLGVHAEDRRFVTPVNLVALDPFVTCDLGWTQALGPDTDLWVQGRNLFNASYQTVKGYPMPGASVTLGLRWSSSAAPPGV